MNYLAHIYLSGTDPDVQVGGLLGDFVKGPLRAEFPHRIETGIRLHRRIDAITDSHPAFRQTLADMPAPWRRFGGILLDVYFDHLLASQWQAFHDGSLAEYCGAFYRQLLARQGMLPEGAQAFSITAPRVSWLENYARRDMIPTMLSNLGKRLRRPVALGDAWPELERRHFKLEQAFHQVMASHRALADQFLQDHL